MRERPDVCAYLGRALIWAPLSFMPLLEEVLNGPLLAEENLGAWVDANVALLREGLYRDG